MSSRARLFFLPGAWHGSWCWTKHVTPLLTTLRYECVAIDYPRKFYPEEPATFDDYVNYTVNQVAEKVKQDSNKSNVVICHSLGGLIGTNVTENAMKEQNINIDAVIHISSAALLNGENIVNGVVGNPLYNQQALLDSVDFLHDGKWSQLRPECVKDMLYHDCTQEDIQLAIDNLEPEIEFNEQCIAKWSDEYYGQVNKLYIECTDDHTLSIDVQREKWEKLGLKREKFEVVSMHTSHSPFFAQPVQLVSAISDWITVTNCQKKAY
eukprot:503012_1